MKIIHTLASIAIGYTAILFFDFSKPERSILAVLCLIYFKLK